MTASGMLQWLRRRRWWLAGGLAVCVAAAAGIVLWTSRGPHVTTFTADGVLPVRMVAPASSDAVVTVGEPINNETLPWALEPLGLPVEIASEPFDGEAELTFTYDPADLPPAADPTTGMTILEWIPDLEQWIPAGGDVDPVAHTVTVHTTHFSTWVPAITDPAELAAMQMTATRLHSSLGGKIGELITGSNDTLSCSTSSLLLPATAQDPLALPAVQLCEEVLSDGMYRLQLVNNSGMPRRFTLPDGFTESNTDYRTDAVINRMLEGDDHAAIVPNGGSLDVRFAGAAVAADTTITGDIDFSAYFLEVERLVLSAALSTRNEDDVASKVVELMDQIDSKADLWDCFLGPLSDLQSAIAAGSAADMSSSFVDVLTDCSDALADAITEVLRVVAGTVGNALENFFKGRITAILAIPKLLQLARDELTGIPAAILSMSGTDTAATIRPTRYMTFAEAQALPPTALADTGDCQQLPAGTFLPAGAPADVKCVYPVSADLDGNGAPDELLIWANSDQPPTRTAPVDQGAVAYLDDGSFHLVEEPAATWYNGQGINLAHPSAVVSLGADVRQQVLAAVSFGSSTVWSELFALGDDGRLHAVDTFPTGGAVAYSTRWGCITSGGEPLVAVTGTQTVDLTGVVPGVLWSIDYGRLVDHHIEPVGTRSGFVASVQDILGDPQSGSDCSTPDPVTRGPEIGTISPTPSSRDGAVTALLTAVLAADQSAGSATLAGSFTDLAWHGGTATDVWSRTGQIAAADPVQWSAPAIECTDIAPTTRTTAESECTATASTGARLTFLVQATAEGNWVIGGVVGDGLTDTPAATPTPAPTGTVKATSFYSPSGNILCGVYDQTVLCTIATYQFPKLTCDIGQPGFTVTLQPGRPAVASGCANDATIAFGQSAITAAYGTTVDLGPANCTVTQVNVTCTNPAGHGMSISKAAHTEN